MTKQYVFDQMDFRQVLSLVDQLPIRWVGVRPFVKAAFVWIAINKNWHQIENSAVATKKFFFPQLKLPTFIFWVVLLSTLLALTALKSTNRQPWASYFESEVRDTRFFLSLRILKILDGRVSQLDNVQEHSTGRVLREGLSKIKFYSIFFGLRVKIGKSRGFAQSSSDYSTLKLPRASSNIYFYSTQC